MGASQINTPKNAHVILIKQMLTQLILTRRNMI